MAIFNKTDDVIVLERVIIIWVLSPAFTTRVTNKLVLTRLVVKIFYQNVIFGFAGW